MNTHENQSAVLQNERSATTSVSLVKVDEDGVVCWTYRAGANVNLAEAKEEVGVVGALVDRVLDISAEGNPRGNKVPLLIDIRPVRAVARDARALLSSDDVSSRWCVSGLALVINSSISRMIGNAVLSWQKPKHPTKLFNDVESARKWLLEQPPMGLSSDNS